MRPKMQRSPLTCLVGRPRRRARKKKKGGGYMEYLMPTNREVNMADAYGGMAKG